MYCVEFDRFLRCGSTRPFLARDEQNIQWVIKAHGNPLGVKTIFNEFVAGSLANKIELPWPDISLVQLAPRVITDLNKLGFRVHSEWAVGIKYITDLRKVKMPSTGSNIRHSNLIPKLFPNKEDSMAFYGKAVFDNWVFLRDTKYDTLLINSSSDPIFLDASYAFYIDGEEEWSCNIQWEETAIDLRSPYLQDIVINVSHFEPWLAKIDKINRSDINRIFKNIPEAWSVPKCYLQSLEKVLGDSRNNFVPIFRRCMEYIVGMQGSTK
ncbi:hypothetical protein MYX76_13640 [Desulfobacterota bacterium AH_259_B03_O07]|nr:hypothetical protein [Desulfobacterota bacterium AH_259_B03_O07]